VNLTAPASSPRWSLRCINSAAANCVMDISLPHTTALTRLSSRPRSLPANFQRELALNFGKSDYLHLRSVLYIKSPAAAAAAAARCAPITAVGDVIFTLPLGYTERTSERGTFDRVVIEMANCSTNSLRPLQSKTLWSTDLILWLYLALFVHEYGFSTYKTIFFQQSYNLEVIGKKHTLVHYFCWSCSRK
jgi:hypothetical protein